MTPEQIRAYNAFANSYKKIFHHFVHQGTVLKNSKNNHIQKSKNLLRAFNKPVAAYKTTSFNVYDPYTGTQHVNAKNAKNAEKLFQQLRKNLRLKATRIGLPLVQVNAGGNLVHLPPGVIRHILKLL